MLVAAPSGAVQVAHQRSRAGQHVVRPRTLPERLCGAALLEAPGTLQLPMRDLGWSRRIDRPSILRRRKRSPLAGRRAQPALPSPSIAQAMMHEHAAGQTHMLAQNWGRLDDAAVARDDTRHEVVGNDAEQYLAFSGVGHVSHITKELHGSHSIASRETVHA